MAAKAIAATRPQAVIVAGSTRDAATFVKTLRAERSNAMILTASAIDTGKAQRLFAWQPRFSWRDERVTG